MELGPCQVQTHHNDGGCQPCGEGKAPSEKEAQELPLTIDSQAPPTPAPKRKKNRRNEGACEGNSILGCLYWLASVAIGNPRPRLWRPPALELRKTTYNDRTVRWKKPLTSRPRSKEGQTGVPNPLQASPDNSRTPPLGSYTISQ